MIVLIVMAKILHRFYDLHCGGAEVVIGCLVRALPQHTHVLVFNTFRETWLTAQLLASPQVSLVQIEGSRLRDTLVRESPDVVLFHYYPPMGADDIHELPSSMQPTAAIYNHWYHVTPFFPAIRSYCFPSPWSYRSSGRDVPEGCKTMILNPVADEFFAIEHRSRFPFCVGRHSRSSPRKFPSAFFDLCEQIDVPDLDVLVLGYLAQHAETLEQRIAAFRHSYWLLPGNTVDVKRFLSFLDVYLYNTHESFIETSPLAILEALAAGISVVAEKKGGIVDLVVPGETGYLCSTIDEYIAAVQELYHDVDRRSSYSRAAREWARSHASLSRYTIEVSKWLGL